MELHEHIERLFAYDDWANKEVVRGLKAGATERSRKLMAHIVAAEWLWLARLKGEAQPMAVWPELSVEECEHQLPKLAQAWSEHLAGAALEDEIAYTNTKGERFRNKVVDVLTHVVMHSAYHRGQIAADVRASGGQPAYTDFIEAVRKKRIE